MLAAQEMDMKVNLLAINHWERAIETHAANHPSAVHLCESVERIDPTKEVKSGKLDLLWASPECTHHSNARGGRPRSDQSRASAWLILKWLSELYVKRVIIENVPEFLSWGPLDNNGRPVQGQKGKIFKAFITSLQSLGYTVDWKILTAADYGDPTTRHRLFIQAVRGRKKILWPEITHMDGDGGILAGCQPYRTARDIIDWSIPETSIFDRKKPLADATIRRIAVGIEKYWKDYAKPFLAILYGTNNEGFYRGNQPRSIDRPLSTVTASRGFGAIVQPFITRYQGDHEKRQDGGNRNHEIERSLPTVDTSNRYALVEPFVFNIGQNSVKDRTHSIHEPLSTVVCKAEHCLIEPGPLRLDIRFRMLKNHELKRAQGFSDDYKITGNITEQTKQIGNAVPVLTAKALALASLTFASKQPERTAKDARTRILI